MNSKLNLSVIILFCVVLISSCKKDNDNPTPEPTIPALESPLLVVGNYWVYETIEIDFQGNVSSTSLTDSVFIEKDTLINGVKWFKQVSTGFSFNGDYTDSYFQRDSAGILVNNFGDKPLEKYKTPGVIGSSIYFYGADTMYTTVSTLKPQDTTVVLPSGTFTVKNIKELYDFRSNPPENRFKESTQLFYEKWGLILFSTTFYARSPANAHFEKRLVRYHVK
jgi:hypothetical protein